MGTLGSAARLTSAAVTTPRIFEPGLGRIRLHLDACSSPSPSCSSSSRDSGFEGFPISFFGDEAIQSVTAADLIRDGFRGQRGELLPTYFENGGTFNLAVSVHAQVVPHALFGFWHSLEAQYARRVEYDREEVAPTAESPSQRER